jgi:hypothetical protein
VQRLLIFRDAIRNPLLMLTQERIHRRWCGRMQRRVDRIERHIDRAQQPNPSCEWQLRDAVVAIARIRVDEHWTQ